MSSYVDDEIIRQQNEIIRQQNETTRQQNEKIRQQNEISRLQNEQERIEYYNQRTQELNSINEELQAKTEELNSVKIQLQTNTQEISSINTQIQNLFQSVSNGKSLIASAITDKGVTTSENDTFETMAENILLINTNSVDVDINTEGLLLYVNASKKMPINNTTWKSLIGSRAINLHNTTEAYFITKSDGSGYIDNVGKLYGTLEENLNLGTSMTLVMKINNNSINGWTELFATGMGDNAIRLTYGNNNNPILFAHDDVQNEYIKLSINQWYEVAVVLFSNKIDYYLNGNLVGTSTVDSTASTDVLY